MVTNNNDTVRILVVDDEGAIRYSVTKTLQLDGYQVEAAANGEEALQLMQQMSFEVVLTDIRMPGLSGVDLLARISSLSPDTSVILMTGYATLATAVESLRLGAHDYLVKPSSNQDIRDSVRRGIERTRNMRRRRILLSTIESSVDELRRTEEAQNAMRKVEQPDFSILDTQPLSPVMRVTPISTPLSSMQLGPLTLYPGRYQIAVDNKMMDLPPTEFDLLLYLAAHRGRVVPCGELVREVRGYGIDEDEAREVIRPHISNLRRKLKEAGQDPDLVVNVRGIGYRLADVGEV